MSDPQTEWRRELLQYVIGIGLAAALSAPPFALVAWHIGSPHLRLSAILICAMLQIFTHFHYFLHINLSRQSRDDLQLITFSILITMIMVGGMIWIYLDQRAMMGL